MYSDTTVTALGNLNELHRWDNRPFLHQWPENSCNKGGKITKPNKRQKKRIRTAFTTEQLKELERTYYSNKFIDTDNRKSLANKLNLNDKSIKIWFQNRRMKEKREFLESSHESSIEMLSQSSDDQSKSLQTEPMSPIDNIVTDEMTLNHWNSQTQLWNDAGFPTQDAFIYYPELSPTLFHQSHNNFASHKNEDIPVDNYASNIRNRKMYEYQMFNKINYDYMNSQVYSNDINVHPTQYYPNNHKEYNYLNENPIFHVFQ